MDLQPNTPPIGEDLQTLEATESIGILSSRPASAVRSNRSRTAVPSAGEVLIPDSRSDVSPAQSVEHKLTSMLRGGSIPVSHIRLSRLCGRE